MTTNPYKYGLGESVNLKDGVIVGRSEYADDAPTYWVEYTRKGKRVRDWFGEADLERGDASMAAAKVAA